MALMATLTCAQDNPPNPGTGWDDPKPEEPENNFPDEWDAKPECEIDPANKDRNATKEKCSDKPKDRTVEEVAEYDEGMMKEYKEALTDQWSKPRRAYCKMQSNPAYPTSGPYGFINLW